MSEELKEKIQFVKNKFLKFSHFIELKDFRSFLLFTLTGQASTNILAQLGIGGPKEIVNLPYNPLFKIYYQKINLISGGSLVTYVKRDIISEEFSLKKDAPIFKEFLNPNEISLALQRREKFLLPLVSDCSTFSVDGSSPIEIKIDDLFHTLDSFIAITEPNILFVIEGDNESEPDILFTFNMMPELPTGKMDQKSLKIDVYLDKDHKTKDVIYIKREEDYKLNFLDTIKEFGHSELYKSAFSLVLKVKSFEEPY